MTFNEQIASHLNFLRSEGFDIDQIQVDAGFIRCLDQNGLSELCYKTTQTQLKTGLHGLMTWCRCKGGIIKTHKTYGLQLEKTSTIELFWNMSDLHGESDYLRSKGVGYYGIRFRNNSFGRVGVIPMRDLSDRLQSYQLLNPDGSKRFPKSTEIKGLFHALQPVCEGPYGLAESYVTAATCFELTRIPTATVFCAGNLLPVAKAIRSKYPQTPLIIFADNDQHLPENKGIKTAELVVKELRDNCDFVVPDFSGYPTTRQFTDWNDLVREKGEDEVKNLIWEAMKK